MTSRRLGHHLIVAMLLIPVAAGCAASGTTGGGASSAPAGPHITVENFSFTPAVITVPAGTTVTWQFKDSAAHNAVADNKTFASPQLRHTESFSHTFTTPASYPYKCTLHQYMTGEVIVK